MYGIGFCILAVLGFFVLISWGFGWGRFPERMGEAEIVTRIMSVIALGVGLMYLILLGTMKLMEGNPAP